MTFKAIAYDLDDTLIDTSGVLVPIASRAAYDAMSALGLRASFEDFENGRRLGALSMSHQKIFHKLADQYGQPATPEMVQAGIQAFYSPPLPAQLHLLPGALENLKLLSPRCPLFLVTSGIVETQKEKAKRAQLSSYFQGLYFLNSLAKERKRVAFADILARLKIQPPELLVIGNRLSQEIRDGKELGCTTCYFKYGEHVGEVPQDQLEVADFEILNHKDFVSTCRL
ncbi:MAG: HAD family hydrolase [Bdellovibrionales bacterium]